MVGECHDFSVWIFYATNDVETIGIWKVFIINNKNHYWQDWHASCLRIVIIRWMSMLSWMICGIG